MSLLSVKFLFLLSSSRDSDVRDTSHFISLQVHSYAYTLFLVRCMQGDEQLFKVYQDLYDVNKDRFLIEICIIASEYTIMLIQFFDKYLNIKYISNLNI